MDVDVNNLRLFLKENTATQPTLYIRLRDQPTGSAVNTIIENIIAKKFVVVKHNTNRIAILLQRGYSQKIRRKSRIQLIEVVVRLTNT